MVMEDMRDEVKVSEIGKGVNIRSNGWMNS